MKRRLKRAKKKTYIRYTIATNTDKSRPQEKLKKKKAGHNGPLARPQLCS
jgi:hypothetical protein